MSLRGRCCCDTECVFPFETRNPCSSPANALVAGVEIKFYRVSDHSLVATHTTDGTGKVDVTDIVNGETYDAVSFKSGSGQGVVRFTADCSTTVVVPISSQRRSLLVRGCANIALPGAVVTITKSPDFWIQGTTDSSGLFYFYPPTTGTYNYSISGGSKFATASGSVNNASLCATSTLATVVLSPASGHSCCGNTTDTTYGTPQRPHPYPMKFPLTVSLSTGQSFQINNCSGNAYVNVPVANVGGPSDVISCPGRCDYSVPPTLSAGDVEFYVSVAISALNGRLSGNAGGNYTYEIYNPARTCLNSCTLPHTLFQYWWRNDQGHPGGGYVNTSYTLNSSEPYSATIYFSYTGVDSGTIGVDPPGPAWPIASITVSEAS